MKTIGIISIAFVLGLAVFASAKRPQIKMRVLKFGLYESITDYEEGSVKPTTLRFCFDASQKNESLSMDTKGCTSKVLLDSETENRTAVKCPGSKEMESYTKFISDQEEITEFLIGGKMITRTRLKLIGPC